MTDHKMVSRCIAVKTGVGARPAWCSMACVKRAAREVVDLENEGEA
jgi:hypothetical protein